MRIASTGICPRYFVEAELMAKSNWWDTNGFDSSNSLNLSGKVPWNWCTFSVRDMRRCGLMKDDPAFYCHIHSSALLPFRGVRGIHGQIP